MSFSRDEGRNLSNEERLCIYNFLLGQQKEDGRLPWGTFTSAGEKFKVHRHTVERIWQRAKISLQEGCLVANVECKYVGPKEKPQYFENIENIPLECRTTVRTMAIKAGVPKSTLYRRGIKTGLIKPHTNSTKPMLTLKHKLARLEYCLSLVDLRSESQEGFLFKNMENVVHVDEKWFYMVNSNERFYLYHKEQVPYRPVKSKRSMVKVMFLTCVARPRFDQEGNCLFDGKLGMFSFCESTVAIRSSANRPAGTVITKPVNGTRNVIRQMFIEQLLPAIRNKWPNKAEDITIQQDNAPAHIKVHDQEFVEAASKDGWKINLRFQPPNSPDCNILDLGFFAAIQSLQEKKVARTIDELIVAVRQAFEEFSIYKLEDNFLTLQNVLRAIMEEGGGNNYQVPHMRKQVLRRLGTLPRRLSCPKTLFFKTEELIESIQTQFDTERERGRLIVEEFLDWETEVLRQSQLPWVDPQPRSEDVISGTEVDGPPVDEEEWD
jgi:hypothetical protein